MNDQPTPASAFEILAIGTVRGGRAEPIDDDWGEETCQIVLDDRWPAEALAGLEDFSHLDVVYVFDQVDEAKITVDARHPRNNVEWPKVGIFAQRAKGRPNRLGVTTCEIVGVDDRVVTVRGLDAIDGTPVVDLKPYMVEFAPRTEVRQADWSHELMRDYWHRAQTEPPSADDTLRIERLTDQIDLARDAFQMMCEVFDEGGAPLSDHYVARLLADPRFHAFVAVEAGEPVGCITAHDLPMTRHERTERFVYDLAVREDRQRRSIGRLLVEAMVADAARRGIDVVFVPADNDDDHALAFYTSLGGHPAPVTMFDLGAG
jgi:tRNA-Thr(GGU) m(6)t(6)A37 methyltransferase TsaA